MGGRLDARTVAIDSEEIRAGVALGLETLACGAADLTGGGYTVRGANGRLYYVPEDLDRFLVIDETDRATLMTAPGIDRNDLSVRELIEDAPAAPSRPAP